MDSVIIGLSHLHSFWRYAVLIAGVVGFLGALAGWLGQMPARQTARRAGLLYVIAIDVQALMGITLWVLRGGLDQPRPFRLEHPVMMLLAVATIHVGQVLAKRSRSDKAAARTMAIAIAVSYILVLMGIPGLLIGR